MKVSISSLFIAIALFSFSAQALEHKADTVNFKQHEIYAKNATSVEVKVSALVTVIGKCNSAVLMGEFLEVKLPEESWRRYKPYLGELATGQTEMGCDGVKQQVVSEKFVFKAEDNEKNIGLSLLIPASFEVQVKEIR